MPKNQYEEYDDVDQELAWREFRGTVIGLGLIALTGYGLFKLLKPSKPEQPSQNTRRPQTT